MSDAITACENCGSDIVQANKYRTKKTCSKECRYAMAAKSTKEKSGAWETTTCQGCGESFENSVAKPKKFCTRDCFHRSRAEASRVDKTCIHCDKEFASYARTDQVYCSPLCRNRHIAANRKKNYPECRACGASTESYNRVYCPEHTVPGGPKAAPRVTATCSGCGEKFSRPAGYPGKMMFCSIDCSNRNHSRKRARHYQFGDLNLNSSFELRFVACLERLQITWEPWPDDEPFVHDGHTYTPDFCINGQPVEIKGWDHPDSIQPEARAQVQGLITIDRERLGELERVFHRHTALDYMRIDCTVALS